MRRLVLMPAGLLLGFVAAAAVLVAGLASEAAGAPAALDLGLLHLVALLADLSGQGVDSVGLVVDAVWRALLWLCLAPLCIVAVVAEVAGLRSLRWLGGGTGVLAGLAPVLIEPAPGGAAPLFGTRSSLLLFLAGVTGGAVFWLVAGRRDGRVSEGACIPPQIT